MEELSEAELATITAGWWGKFWKYARNVAIPGVLAFGIKTVFGFRF
jgi:hypothetical protein